MTTFDIIKKLSDDRGETVKTVALKLGFGENLFYKWKNQSPTAEKLQLVADYFDVSTDYLLGRTAEKHIQDGDDVIDVSDIVDNNRKLMYKNGELSDEDQTFINNFLRTYLESKEGQDRLKKNNYKKGK